MLVEHGGIGNKVVCFDFAEENAGRVELIKQDVDFGKVVHRNEAIDGFDGDTLAEVVRFLEVIKCFSVVLFAIVEIT